MDQYRDEHIVCANCGTSFLFSASEAAIFNDRGLSAPKRCKECRRARKEQMGGGDAPRGGGQNGPGGRRDGGGSGGGPGQRPSAPRYTGDVNEYRSPMQDNRYSGSPAPWGGGNAPRGPRPAYGQGQNAGQGRRPAQGGRDDGNYRAPSTPQGRPGFGFGGRVTGPATSPGPAQTAPRAKPPAETFSIVCNSCGVSAQVPFKPAEGRDVFCQACYRARKPV